MTDKITEPASKTTLPLEIPSSDFWQKIHRETSQKVHLCFQCHKCAAGCPMAYAMDVTPVQLIQAISLVLEDFVLNSKTMWLCASCQTCNTRCPQDIDIARIMDAAKILAVQRGIPPPVPSVHAFNRTALQNMKWFGRLYELGLIGMLKLRTFQFFKDVGLGLKMFFKGKLKILPPFSFKRTVMTRRIFIRVKKAGG